MAYAAVNSLCTTIRDLTLSSRIYLFPTSVPILKRAFDALMSLRKTMELLDEKSKRYMSRKEVNALDERMKEAIWKFEDLLDHHVYHQIFPQSQILGDLDVNLDELLHDPESFAKELEEFKVEYMYELDHLSPEEDEDVDVDVDVVDEDVDVDVVWNCKMGQSFYTSCAFIRRVMHLTDGSSWSVISLVGMGGIGKTALAKKVFDDPLDLVGFEFECRAWVTIGRNWQSRKLNREILSQLDPSMDQKPMKGGEPNRRRLQEILKAKRCLIVLDDVWDTDLWDKIKKPFPIEPSRRSLVLLTTRLRHVGRYARATQYGVDLLYDDESWDLLRQRVFGEEDECPPELEKPGKEIARKCDGLPLMIITVADLLREDEMTVEHWESVAKKNSSIFTTAYDRVSEVLFPSYEYLTQHLKPCFLYMGVYPIRGGITTSRLLNTWIAEGILLYENETIEECSERYLRGLFDHSVVIVCERSHNSFLTTEGREIKRCRLQSCFWQLCKKEATNSRFFHLLSVIDDVEKIVCIELSMHNQRRLGFHNNILFAINNYSDIVGDVCASTSRSLLCYGPYHPYPVPIPFNLKLLKVLSAFYIRFYEFPMLVFQLVYLRSLDLLFNGKLPDSISKLWNLRFLSIFRSIRIKHSGVTSYMPNEIWDMKQLKCLQVTGSNLPNPSSGASLENLLTLKDVGVETCTKEVLKRIPNLKKLGIRVDLHPAASDDMKALHCLNHVDVLHQLTSLKCTILNPILRSEIAALPMVFPSSLKKLHLSGMGYPWSSMSVIGSLPNLQVLKLRSYAFRGSEWVVKFNQFSSLGVLEIHDTDLVKLKVEAEGFFHLQALHLSNCYKLRDLMWEPNEWCHVTILVTDCNTSTVAFANDYLSRHENCCVPKELRLRYVTSSYMK